MTPTEARKAVPRLHLQLADIVKADQEREIVRELPDELVDELLRRIVALGRPPGRS